MPGNECTEIEVKLTDIDVEMKIKIIKADPQKWYAKLIGKTMTAKLHPEYDCFIVRNYRTILRTIKKDDAIIIES